MYDNRIETLRTHMVKAGVDAVIVPGSDPHLSEYLAEHWKVRDWLCGFNGSAGTLVITRNKAGLWTDSRYFLQAETQLAQSRITLFKDGLPGVPGYVEWLTDELSPGSKLAVNGTCFSLSSIKSLKETLKQKGITLETGHTLAEDTCTERPALPDNPVEVHPGNLAGLSLQEKTDKVLELLKKEGATHYLVNTLDEIAWLLNLRGTDIPFNPVFHAYLITGKDKTILFADKHKLSENTGNYLKDNNIKIEPYRFIYQYLKELPPTTVVFSDPAKTNYTLISALPKDAAKKEGAGIITRLKGLKNPTELQNFKHTMRLDGVAMVRFLKWLEETVPGGSVTELSAAEKVKSFRAGMDGFAGESFATISGYADHGAIVHYSVTPKTDVPLKSEGIYLIDSGGQYQTGTTDLTRTLALGPVSEQAKTDYTLVLKGHIALALAVFPKGTRGVHLDILARQYLWQHQLNYGHGTGHGIGYFLNVHEGPQSIRPQDNGVEMEAGMITSNEPGIYRGGQYGIRTENLMEAIEAGTNDFGTFLAFDTITLCPIDLTLLNVELLSKEEINWLNNYHQKVFNKLSPLLDEEEREWLRRKTKTEAPSGSPAAAGGEKGTM